MPKKLKKPKIELKGKIVGQGEYEKLETENKELKEENINLKTENEEVKKANETLENEKKRLSEDKKQLEQINSELSEKIPKGIAVQEKFGAVINYELAGKTLQRPVPCEHGSLNAVNGVLRSLRASFEGQGARNINQKIRHEITYEY